MVRIRWFVSCALRRIDRQAYEVKLCDLSRLSRYRSRCAKWTKKVCSNLDSSCKRAVAQSGTLLQFDQVPKTWKSFFRGTTCSIRVISGDPRRDSVCNPNFEWFPVIVWLTWSKTNFAWGNVVNFSFNARVVRCAKHAAMLCTPKYIRMCILHHNPTALRLNWFNEMRHSAGIRKLFEWTLICSLNKKKNYFEQPLK